MRRGIVIVGGGSTGLFTAYSLARRGVEGITLLEKKYLGSGSTGRCASGIRASFTSREHVALMRRSIELWLRYNEELGGYGFEFSQTGYVWLARREESLEYFKRLSRLHNELGVATRVVGGEEVKELVPPIRGEAVLGGLHDPSAGKASPFKTVAALRAALLDMGVEIVQGAEASSLILEGPAVRGVKTNKGVLEAEAVLLAAGSETNRLLDPLGYRLPLKNMPRHAAITEAYRPAFDPLVIDWDSPGVPYIVQTDHGGFYMAREIEEEPGMSLYSERMDFLPRLVSPLLRLFPWLANTRILRYWMGYYVTTPDHHPVLGPVPGFEGLYVATGYSGHGYMMGPIVGEVMAEWIISGRPLYPEAARLDPGRFERGELLEEKAIVG